MRSWKSSKRKGCNFGELTGTLKFIGIIEHRNANRKGQRNQLKVLSSLFNFIPPSHSMHRSRFNDTWDSIAEWRSLPSHVLYEVVQWHVQTMFPYLLRENMSSLVGLLRLSNRVTINKAMSLFGGLVILCSDRTWSILWFLDGDIPFCERDISCGELGMSFETQSIPLWELFIYYTRYYFMFNLVFVLFFLFLSCFCCCWVFFVCAGHSLASNELSIRMLWDRIFWDK